MTDSLDTHYSTLIKAITDGRVVPFLGAGVNLCDRPPETNWKLGEFLPSGRELSLHLAECFTYQSAQVSERCPACKSEINLAEEKEKQDLVRVSQYVALNAGTGPLYDELHNIFSAKYPPTSLHQFFARLPNELRLRGYPRTDNPFRRRLVIITTNYDDLLESAFRQAGEPFHVISYMADTDKPDQRGKCWHWAPESEPKLIESSNDYPGLSQDNYPVVVKIHGAVDRSNMDYDSYVITEDHYIDYLTRADISNLLPVPLPAILKRSNFLFLGYSLRDWNLRVILHLIWREQKLNYESWAIQANPQRLDQKFWAKRGVEILDAPLKDYIAALKQRLQSLPIPGGGA